MTIRTGAWIAVAAFFLVAAAGVLLRPLLPVDETRYMAVAWEMWLNRSVLVPTKNFELYAHKPPLLFWSIDLVWLLTGVSEVAGRLVAPAYATLAVILTGALGRRLWRDDPDAGPRAMIAMCATFVFALSAALTMFDTMLAAMTLLGLLALLTAVDTGLRRWWMAVGVAIALGVLAKGPVILFHLGPAIVLTPVWARDRAAVTWRQVAIGALIALGTALVVLAFWLVPAVVTGGQAYRDEVLWTQTAGRMSSSFAHRQPFWFFAALLPAMLFPFAYIPALWREAVRARWRDPGLALAAIWGVSAFVLFSIISGKQTHYLVPELPAVALVAAHLTGLRIRRKVVQTTLRRPLPFRPAVPALIVAAAGCAAIAAWFGLIPLGPSGAMMEPRAMLLAWGLAVLALAWIATSWGGLRGAAVLVLGTMLSLNLLIGLTKVRSEFDSNRVGDVIAPYDEAGIALVNDTYQAEFNFAGRLRHHVASPKGPEALAVWMAAHPKGLVIGRPGADAPAWPRAGSISYRDFDYGLWHVEDAPKGGRP